MKIYIQNKIGWVQEGKASLRGIAFVSWVCYKSQVLFIYTTRSVNIAIGKMYNIGVLFEIVCREGLTKPPWEALPEYWLSEMGLLRFRIRPISQLYSDGIAQNHLPASQWVFIQKVYRRVLVLYADIKKVIIGRTRKKVWFEHFRNQNDVTLELKNNWSNHYSC